MRRNSIIHSLEESLQANRIDKIYGIVNGTTNYILTRMSKNAEDYAVVLKDAQRTSWPSPTRGGWKGWIPAYKLSILSSLAFHGRVPFEDVYVEGITHVSAEDIRCGQELGYTLKLLAIAKRDGMSVKPAYTRPSSAAITRWLTSPGSFNAVYLHGHACKEMMFWGAARAICLRPAPSSTIWSAPRPPASTAILRLTLTTSAPRR